MFRTSIIGLAVAALLGGSVHAQVLQTGSVSAGHAASWATNGVIQDAGSAASGSLNTLGITATGAPFCINDAAISGGYHQLCLGSNVLAAGGLISYNAYGGASTLPLNVNINGVTTSLGTGTVSSGLAGQVTYYNANGTTVSGNPYLNILNGQLTLGLANATAGSLILNGSSSGTIDIETAAGAAGSYNFILPTTVGTAGYVLTSQGGGSTPMTWTAVGGTVNSGNSGQFTYYATTGTAVSGSTALSVSGGVVSTGGNLNVAGALVASGTLTSGANSGTLGSVLLNGSSSGTITLKPQAAAGTYNWNYPITAGTSGYPLLSGGGGGGAMTWGTLSGNTSTFGTTSGSLTSGHAAVFDSSGNIIDGGALPVGTIQSGTASQLAWYAGSGTTISGNGNATMVSGALTLGSTGATAGSAVFSGSSTGAVTVKGSSTTVGTYNFNLPITAGSSGQPMLSGGGAASAMTWGTVSGNTTKFGTVTGALVNGDCIAADASGNLIDNGSACGTGGSGTVTSSTAGQIAYYAASNNSVAGNSSLTISGGAVTVGVTGVTAGSVLLSGSSTGAVTVKGSTTTVGTYNFNLPTTAGSAGQVLTSQGGGSSAMTWASPGIAWGGAPQTGNFNATANTNYCANTTSGAITVTLPTTPADGSTVGIADCYGQFAVNNLTLAAGGSDMIMVSLTSLVDNIPWQPIKVVYSTTQTNWSLSP